MNVIAVLLDSLNFDCLEPYGPTQVPTPNLWRVAQRGLFYHLQEGKPGVTAVGPGTATALSLGMAGH